ncbi:MAG: TPM domain-containing protein [Bdellovibrionaceae bacterium]|nr:TPM domain-containing protein [Pseudobdellovibrionaceae bacterium]
MRGLVFKAGLLVALLFAAVIAEAQFTVPPLREPVQDMAGVLDAGTKSELEALIRNAHAAGKIQLQILIVPTLGGEPVEQAALKVVDAWKLGTAKGDQGALFLVAINDRKMRIEVGQGLEGDLPDVTAKRILADRVAPFFRSGNYAGGIREGTLRILAAAGDEFVEAAPTDEGMSDQVAQYIHLMILVVIILLSFLGRGRRRRGGLAPFLGGYYLGSGGGWSGGGGGSSWGGGSGGGWSGGGGGFSGGGASGDW